MNFFLKKCQSLLLALKPFEPTEEPVWLTTKNYVNNQPFQGHFMCVCVWNHQSPTKSG